MLNSDISTTPLPFMSASDALAFWQGQSEEITDGWAIVQELAARFNMPGVDLNKDVDVDAQALLRIPEHFAMTHQVLPLDMGGAGQISIAVATPFMGTVPLELESALGRPVRLLLAQADLLQQLIETSYASQGNLDMLSGLDDGGFEDLENIEDLKDMAQAAPVVKLVNTIFHGGHCRERLRISMFRLTKAGWRCVTA